MAVATAEGQPKPRIWDLSTGTPVCALEHRDMVGCASWGTGADGRQLLATGCDDHVARIWDPDTGQLLRTLTGHTAGVR